MAGFFSSATLEQIRAASDIVDVIGSSIPLKRAGANFVALCPFHKEKTPSFNVNPHRQIFHCFGCHKGGDVFTFIKEYENIDFVDAVKRLAERAKIPLEYEKGKAEPSRHLKDQLLEIHEQIARRWQNCLANEAAGQPGRDYLKKRGVSDEAIKQFRIGCAPPGWDDTVNWAKSKNFDLAVVEKAGLIIRKSEARAGDVPSTAAPVHSADETSAARFYDRFRGRLMFPICDEQGRVIGFSGRVLSGDEKTAKYVNSPETPIFTKSKVFFGLDKSKRAILDAGFAIVCEGQLDLIACFMAGVQNIVAPQGTAFTDQHARILKRYVDEVVLCFDSDEAGQNAAVRSLDHLLASGLAVRVAVVPAPHDPDSFIKANGGEAFRELIGRAEGFFDYYLNRLCATHEAATDKGRLAILTGMAEAVLKTGNGVLIDKYAQKTALRLGVSSDAVRAEFKKISRPHGKLEIAGADENSTETPIAQRPSTQEFWLLKLLFLQEELARWCAANLDINWIQHELAREIVARRIELQRQEKWSSLAAFLDECETPEMRNLITEAATEERPIPNPAQQLGDVVLRLRNQFIDRQLMLLIHRANQPETDDAARLELLRKQQELRRLKRQPLPPVVS
ncbi:MAG TPA: CHC2 zinc finger domain-containing protein [Verrucomicrobiae bacterium]|nr:CHC2 zinc finger domain-containing protein [Verrucomicrobiae bacterium]